MWRHGDPEWWLAGEARLPKDGLVIGAMGLEVHIKVVQSFEEIVPRFTPLADEGRAGKAHVHVAG
jgi:hypothetical protein